MTDPWHILNLAAVTLGEMAGKATNGPWREAVLPGDPDRFSNVLDGEGRSLFSSSCCSGHCYGHVTESADAKWIAALSPDTADPLVDWLLAEARFVRRNHATMYGDVEHLPSLRFARMILGEETS